MRIKGLIDEDFVNYRKTSMFIITCYCNWKCCHEAGIPVTVCQNEPMAKQPIIEINDNDIVLRYLSNPISQSVVFGGLEPMEQFDELYSLISMFRTKTNDDIVIYTGFNPEEISDQLVKLQQFPNIIIKFGRFKPGQEPHYDEIMGVKLASDNQFGMKIS